MHSWRNFGCPAAGIWRAPRGDCDIAAPNLLEIRNLTLTAHTEKGSRELVHEVELELKAGQIVALVGESGAGKTLTGLAILGLLPPTVQLQSGSILFDGVDLAALKPKEMHKYRGRRIAYIPQEPASALDPLMSVGDQIGEGMQHHLNLKGPALHSEMVRLVRQVEFSEPAEVLKKYPHQLSGGMRQRALIAIALSCRPTLVIADELTSSVDLVTRNRLIQLLVALRNREEAAMLVVTHDLFVARQLSESVAVMRNGRVFEEGPTARVLSTPVHPYTRELVHASGILEGDRGGNS